MKWLNGEKEREGEEKKEDREVVVVVAGLSRESLNQETKERGREMSFFLHELLITIQR